MVLHVPLENEDVIDVTKYEIVQIFMKNIVHHMLENIKYVNKAKWHHKIFKMAITSFEHCLPLIAFLNAHQFICSMSINFGVHLGMTKLVQQP